MHDIVFNALHKWLRVQCRGVRANLRIDTFDVIYNNNNNNSTSILSKICSYALTLHMYHNSNTLFAWCRMRKCHEWCHCCADGLCKTSLAQAICAIVPAVVIFHLPCTDVAAPFLLTMAAAASIKTRRNSSLLSGHRFAVLVRCWKWRYFDTSCSSNHVNFLEGSSQQ